MPRRSVLFSPGDQPDLMRNGPGTGADVVVFDLEDAVAPDRKSEAREAVRGVLADESFDPDCAVWVRVNPVGTVAESDVADALVADSPLEGVVLPKVSGAADVDQLVSLLDDGGLALPVVPVLESAAGVLHAEAVAAADRVTAVVIGAEDLAADIGATRTDEGTEVLYAREHVVLAAAAAGVDAIDTVYADIEDLDGLAADTQFALELGFDGKLAIHPDQVSVVNEAFTPAEDELAWAERVLAARDEADAEGRGVFRVDGEMIDAPLIAQAEQIMERARAAGIR